VRLERRGFLGLVAAPIGVAALSAVPRAGAQATGKTAERETASPMPALAGYLARAGTADLPEAVVAKARHHILDTLAAMVSGAYLKVGVLARDFAKSQGGTPEAAVAGSGLLTTAINAALANGMMAHADETDDSHEPSVTHPGCAVVPAALAAAEREDASGLRFLKGVVAGYDVGCRMNLALDPRLLSDSQRATHSIGGVFGAAAAAATVFGLDATQVAFVMDYTGQQASGVRYWVRDSEHVEKAFVFGGMPARDGLTAAVLVRAGFTGVADCFSGEHNFFQAFSTDPKP
jgi:2-methylcitrate dehydratase PrpD